MVIRCKDSWTIHLAIVMLSSCSTLNKQRIGHDDIHQIQPGNLLTVIWQFRIDIHMKIGQNRLMMIRNGLFDDCEQSKQPDSQIFIHANDVKPRVKALDQKHDLLLAQMDNDPRVGWSGFLFFANLLSGIKDTSPFRSKDEQTPSEFRFRELVYLTIGSSHYSPPVLGELSIQLGECFCDLDCPSLEFSHVRHAYIIISFEGRHRPKDFKIREWVITIFSIIPYFLDMKSYQHKCI